MKTVLLSILISLLFTSCYFTDFSGIKTNNLNERVFENSAQNSILNRYGKVEADIKVIYLSDISSNFKDSDVFLLSIYFFDRKIDGLSSVDYSIKMNGIRPFKIEEINPRSRIISQIKLLNPWFNNYIVYFKKIEVSNKFVISFGYSRFGRVSLNLIKGGGELRDYPTIVDTLYN